MVQSETFGNLKKKRICRKRSRVTPWGLVGFTGHTTPGLIQKIEQGFPISSVEKLRKRLKLNLGQIAEAIQITPKTLERRQKEGRLHKEESDKIFRYARLYSFAVDLFEGDEDEAVKWFNTPNYGLGDVCPFNFAKTEVGAREVEALIMRLEHGVF